MDPLHKFKVAQIRSKMIADLARALKGRTRYSQAELVALPPLDLARLFHDQKLSLSQELKEAVLDFIEDDSGETYG